MEPREVYRIFLDTHDGVDVVPVMRDAITRWRATEDEEERRRAMQSDPVGAVISPDVEIRVHFGLEAGTLHGWEGLMELYEGWYTLWEEYIFENSDVREFDDGVMFSRADLRGRGREGLQVEMTAYQVVRIRDGKIVVWEMFSSEEEALRAAGG